VNRSTNEGLECHYVRVFSDPLKSVSELVTILFFNTGQTKEAKGGGGCREGRFWKILDFLEKVGFFYFFCFFVFLENV
jgi:hypothetical protein